uniref:Uncharacterized protein n=1 Tax=viral metagenome TaxID=1070528 RepID=A0A6M3XZ80_9ZZZZ
MKVIKVIDYVDGDRHYSEADIIEVKDYIVADISEKDEDGNVLYGERVWFTFDKIPFKLTEVDIALLYAEPEEEIIEEAEVIDG